MKMNKYEEKAKEIIDEKESSTFLIFLGLLFGVMLSGSAAIMIINFNIVMLFFLISFCMIIFLIFSFPCYLFLRNDKEYQMAKKIMKDYERKCEKEKEEIEKLKKIKNEEIYKELKEYADKL